MIWMLLRKLSLYNFQPTFATLGSLKRVPMQFHKSQYSIHKNFLYDLQNICWKYRFFSLISIYRYIFSISADIFSSWFIARYILCLRNLSIIENKSCSDYVLLMDNPDIIFKQNHQIQRNLENLVIGCLMWQKVRSYIGFRISNFMHMF